METCFLPPFPPYVESTWKHVFLPPFPPYAESTWKHVFSEDLLYGFVNIFLNAGVGSVGLQLQLMFLVSPLPNLEIIQRL